MRSSTYGFDRSYQWVSQLVSSLVSRDLWPARSPDMTPCDFYLWGRLKNAVYKTNPRTLEELKRHICDEINISRGEVQRAMGNFINRC